MAGFSVRFEGGEKVKRALNEVADRAEHLKTAWKVVAEILMTSTEKTFEQQGRPRWQGLAPATIVGRLGGAGKAWTRRRRGRQSPRSRAGIIEKVAGFRILQRSGHLKQSIATPGAKGSLYEVSDEHAQIGSNLVYAAIHQYGGQAGRKTARVTIPERPYVAMQDEDRVEIVGVVSRYIVTGEVARGGLD